MNKFLIFDLDGTILDSMWAWDELGDEIIEKYPLKDYKEYDQRLRQMSTHEFAERISYEYKNTTPDGLSDEWSDWMRYKYYNVVKERPGISAFLDIMKKRGHRMCIASATRADLVRDALNHFGLLGYFDFIISEKQIGKTKEEPDIYYECIKRAGTTVDNSVIFEDAVHAVKTAKKYGFEVCGIEDASMVNYKEIIKSTVDLYVDDFSDADLIINKFGL